MLKIVTFILCFISFADYSNASELSTELASAKADYTAKNYDTAFGKFKNLAELNNSEAQFYLGEMYNEGNGIKKNKDIAKSWYRKSAIAGFVKSQTALAILSYNSGEYEETMRWFRRASENEDPAAIGWLGSFYMTGEFQKYGLKQDFDLALTIMEKAVQKGDADSFAPYVFLNVLLNLDETDFNFSENIERLDFAIKQNSWLSEDAKQLLKFLNTKIASKDGDPVQQLNLADFYNQGLTLKLDYYDPDVVIKIVKKNVSKSLYWAQLSSRNGNINADEMVSELIILDLISGNQIENFENLKQVIETECNMDFACAFDKIWQYLDVSKDGNLSLAEISRFQRALVNLAYVENSEEIKIEELSAANFISIMLLPIASKAIINSFDYNNDEVLQKHEIFGDTEFAKLVGIDAEALANGFDFGRLGDRLNEQLEKFPFATFK
jgi:TPR repeat protein